VIKSKASKRTTGCHLTIMSVTIVGETGMITGMVDTITTARLTSGPTIIIRREVQVDRIHLGAVAADSLVLRLHQGEVHTERPIMTVPVVRHVVLLVKVQAVRTTRRRIAQRLEMVTTARITHRPTQASAR